MICCLTATNFGNKLYLLLCIWHGSKAIKNNFNKLNYKNDGIY